MKKIIGAFIALYSAFAFSATTVPVQLINPTGSTSGQAVVSTGNSSAPAWGGIGLNGISAVAANTVLANATNASASPTAFAMPSCSAAGNSLQWASGTGFTCATGYAQLASPTFTGTVTTAALTATGTITPSQTAGIVGTTTNNSPNAGSVGEIITSTSGSISLTSATATNLTTISLTAGDWDVMGNVVITGSATNVTIALGGSNSVSATFGTVLTYWQITPGSAMGVASFAIPSQAVRVASTTTYYLIGYCGFSSGTCTGQGNIWARRRR